MKADYQKALKNLISFFLSNPVPLNRKSYLKQKGSGTSDQSLFRLKNDDIMVIIQKHDVVFELFQKLHLQIYASQFMTS